MNNNIIAWYLLHLPPLKLLFFSYRQNVVKLRQLMLDQPESPGKRVIWWIEYVIRNGGAKHLQSRAANMSWMQYLEFEVMLMAGAVIVISIIAMILALLLLYKFVMLYIVVNRKSKLKKM